MIKNKKQNKHDMISHGDMFKYNAIVSDFIKDKEIINISEFTETIELKDKDGNIVPERRFFASITYRE